MAKYIIKHICGHEKETQLYGKHTDRDSKFAWMQDHVCPDCFKAQKEKERANKEKERQPEIQAENQLAEIFSQEMSLPSLCGSEKQIAWAQSIRRTVYRGLIDPPPEVIDLMGLEPSAKWWIDNRSGSPRDVMISIVRNYPEKAEKITRNWKKGEHHEI